MNLASRIAIATLGAIAASAGSGALAQQTGNPAVADPQTPRVRTGRPPAEFPNTPDIIFMQQAAIGGSAEVQIGKLAQQRAQSEAVKSYAERMVKDNETANDKLAPLLRSNKVEAPKDLDPEHKAARDELQKLEGSRFDVRYIEGQIKAHQKTVQLLIHEVGAGQDARVKSYAAETLPVVMRHLEMARSIHAQLTTAPDAKSTAGN